MASPSLLLAIMLPADTVSISSLTGARGARKGDLVMRQPVEPATA